MRKFLIALTALSAVSGLTAATAPAKPVMTVHAKRLGAIPALPYYETEWVAKADARTIAWGSTARGSHATTVTDGGSVRTVPDQPGCTPKTAGAGNIGFDCSPAFDETRASTTLATRVVSLAGRTVADASATVPVAPLDDPAPRGLYGATFRLDGLGTRWLHFSQDCDYKYCPGPAYSLDLNWRTGAAATVKTLDPRLHEDLDAAALTVPLCAPLRSDMAAITAAEYSPTVIPVVLDGRWALLARPASDPGDAPAWQVQRCGSARPVTLPAGSTPVAIGAGWALLARGASVRLLRLADRRLVTVTGDGRLDVARPQAAITAGRVVFTGYDGQTESVYTARLPRK